ncbi:MAG TPA: FliM/FliN family flagellar motor switch protein [Polyangiaceae bacterium]|nr:FliM/FliN family flagellar motor switch protein [Polyangiaceae bacterium]
MVRAVLPYPWERLPHVSREAIRAERRVRRAVSAVLALDRVGAALSEVLSAEVRLDLLHAAPVAPEDERAIFFESVDGAVAFAVEPEPSLASLVLARVLRRAAPLTALDTPLDAVSRGALSAVVVEIARRAGIALPLRARHEPPAGAHDARVDVRVGLDGRAYHVAISLYDRAIPTSRALAPTDLRAVGALPIRIPIVAAVSFAEPVTLAALASGDVWLPGDGWLSRGEHGPAPMEHGSGDTGTRGLPWNALARAALCPEDGERGVEIGRSDAGRLVLRGNVVALGADVEDALRGGDEAMNGTEETLTSMALDAPLVVRVEVGSVTLTARQWGALRPGDVLETGLRLAEPAVLRVAGREVARGELVSIDGELGVRIREIAPAERNE